VLLTTANKEATMADTIIRVKQYDRIGIRDIVEVSPDTLETYLKEAVNNLIEGVNSRIEIEEVE
jgi:hypothetical protein